MGLLQRMGSVYNIDKLKQTRDLVHDLINLS